MRNVCDPIDFDGIKAAALRSARQLLQERLPGGKFQGDEYVVRNPLRNDQYPGSFKINCKTQPNRGHTKTPPAA